MKKAFRIAVALIICAAFSLQAFAQNATNRISGTVVSNGEPVIGASVMVKNTSVGAATDIDGNFTIQAADDAVLVVSAIGYQTKEVAVNGASTLNISLEESSTLLEDAVVVGYGVQKKVNLTGAVASVSTEELEGKPIANVLEGLQGTTPGLVIQQGASTPGGSPTLNIRGYNTMNDNNPLVIIDGIEGSLSNLNPQDIDQISILKDASSTAIYGSRASNGVVLVTTKKGAAGQVSVNYDLSYGLQQPTALPTVVDSWIYAELYNEAAVNSGRSTKFTAEDIAGFRNGGTNVKWINELYKSYASQQSHNLSVTGGTKTLSYMASLGFLDQNSLFKGPDYGYNRYNGRLNIQHQVNDRLTVGATAQFTRNKIKDHAYWTEWIIEQCNRMPSIYEIKNEDGTYTYPSGSNSNSLERLEKGGYRQSVNDDISGTIDASLRLFDGLYLKSTIGGRTLNNSTHENRMASESPASGDKENHISESFFKSTKLTTTVTLNYDQTFGKHTVGALLGYAYEGESWKNFSTQRITDDSKYDVFVGSQSGNKVSNDAPNGGGQDWSLYSAFARLTYNYDEKYLAEFNIRDDYSSYFAKGNRSGIFPSFSLGWRISQEDFWDNIRPVIPSLKLRGSWGLVGNNRIGAYQYLQTVSVTQGINFGGQLAPTAWFSSVDPGIKWETTRMADLGLDMGLLKNDLNLSFDVFSNRTRDILVQLPVPGMFGNGAPTSNAAVVDSFGWEFSANYHFKTGAVHHNIAANVSDSWNNVVDTKGETLYYGYDVVSVIKEGYPLYSYYALRSNGFFQSDEEAAAAPHLEGVVPRAGDIRYIDKPDADGNTDGVINDDDRFVVGNDFPRYTFGFNYGLQWKGFFFSAFLQGVGMRSRWMRGEAVEAFHNNNEGPVHDFHIDRWTPVNTDATYPRLTMGSESTNNATKSDFWIQDAAYLRVKNVQLGYDFQGDWLKAIRMQNLRAYVSVENALTFSKMKGGWDPEYNADGSGRAYPVARVWSVGLNVKF
ncbi:MAG: TonB-dependent receptor [Bacteroidales bacterium]|nr:TonB-dependent receptor [Bacteroidales bacterium]MBQ6082442.1 TonB-dependent receptor [Bacteroidales bacterium]